MPIPHNQDPHNQDHLGLLSCFLLLLSQKATERSQGPLSSYVACKCPWVFIGCFMVDQVKGYLGQGYGLPGKKCFKMCLMDLHNDYDTSNAQFHSLLLLGR